jgi:hypothetical protein
MDGRQLGKPLPPKTVEVLKRLDEYTPTVRTGCCPVCVAPHAAADGGCTPQPDAISEAAACCALTVCD